MVPIMKTCNKCNIQIKDDTKFCPLCHEPLDHLDKYSSKGTYPSFKINEHKYHLVSKLVIILSIIFSISAMVTNYLTYNGIAWSIISIAAIIYTWILVIHSITNESNIAKKILEYTIFTSVLVILIDLMVGYSGWSVNYVIPELLILSNIGILILMIVNRMSWHDYVLYQMILMFFSVILLVLYFLKIVGHPLFTLLAASFSLAIFLSTLLFGDKSVKSELRRRFYL